MILPTTVGQERWCRLRENMLFYFKSSEAWSEPAGVIVLDIANIKVDPVAVDGSWVFTLGNPYPATSFSGVDFSCYYSDGKQWRRSTISCWLRSRKRLLDSSTPHGFIFLHQGKFHAQPNISIQ